MAQTIGTEKESKRTSSQASSWSPQGTLNGSKLTSAQGQEKQKPNTNLRRLLKHKHKKQKEQKEQSNQLGTANDNYWSTSLYSEPPLLTSATCVHALHELFTTPDVLAVATESSSHPTGLTSVLAQPWLYAGGGLGNIPECPLQTCLAGAGTRRDSITFASVCVPYECHAQDLAAHDFPASLERAAQHTLNLESLAGDDDDPFEFINHPEKKKKHEKAIAAMREKDNRNDNDSLDGDETDDKIWWHISPDQEREWTHEYINLHQQIAKLNDFLQTGWTCGNYRVPWHAFPFGVPYLVICVAILILAALGTFRPKIRQRCRNPGRRESDESNSSSRTVLIETDDEHNALVFQEQKTLLHGESNTASATSSVVTLTNTNQDAASLSSDTSTTDPPVSPFTEASPSAPRISSNSPSQLDQQQQQPQAHRQEQPKKEKSIVSMWNIHTNWEKLCSSRHEDTACLDGLRVFSILWVILGHVMAIQSSTGGGYSNPVDFLPPTGFTTTFWGQIIFASRFAVDTFLVISGYLLVIVIARKAPTLTRQGSNRAATFFRLIGLRLLRILPLYGMCLGFYTQVAPHLYWDGYNEGGGPFWYQWDSLLSPCREFGWTNWLFVNNFIPFEKSNTETCFYHSWYLAVDMQLFLLFGLPVTFFVFLKNPTYGRRLTLGLWWASVLVTVYLSYVRHWSINTFDGLQVARFDVEGYAKPHVRGQAYFAGMYVAMAQLTKHADSTARPSVPQWKHTILLWGAICALGMITFGTVTGAYARRPCQYSEYPSQDQCGSLWSPAATFVYTGTSRAIWSCSIATLMTLCLDGNGGWLNQLLSWRMWAPLSQLSFGAYLIHPIVIFVWLLGEKQKEVYSLMTFGMSLISVCVVSFAFALVAALLVEFPMATLISEKLIKKKPRVGRSSPSSPLHTGEVSQETMKLISSGSKTVSSGYGTA